MQPIPRINSSSDWVLVDTHQRIFLDTIPPEIFSIVVANLDIVSIRQLEQVSSRIKNYLQQPKNQDHITKKIVSCNPIVSREARGESFSAVYMHLEGNFLHIQETGYRFCARFVSIKLPNSSRKSRDCSQQTGQIYFFKEFPEHCFSSGNDLGLFRENLVNGEKVIAPLKGGPTFLSVTAFDPRTGCMAGVTVHENFEEIKTCDKNLNQLFVLDNDNSPLNKEHLAIRRCIALNFNTIKPTDQPSKVEKHQVIQTMNSPTYSFHSLPEEIILHLFSFCDERSLTRLNQVCSAFNRINATHTFSSTLIGAFGAGKFMYFKDEGISNEQLDLFQKKYKPLKSIIMNFEGREALYGHVNYLRSYSMKDGRILRTEFVGGQITSLASSPEYVAVGYENHDKEAYIHLHASTSLEKQFEITLDFSSTEHDYLISTHFHKNHLFALSYRNSFFMIDLSQISDKPYKPKFTNLTCPPAFDKHLFVLCRNGTVEVRNIQSTEVVVQIPIDSKVNKILFKTGRYLVAHTNEKVIIWHMNNEKFGLSTMKTRTLETVSLLFNTLRAKMFW